jgi:hypothetical protein
MSTRCLLFAAARFVVVVVVLVVVIELVRSGLSAQHIWELVTLAGLVAARQVSPAVSRRVRRRT